MGGFSGRLGTAVGYMWNGKWCLRAHNPMVHNPRTQAQEEHRAVFKQEVQLAANMRSVVVRSLTAQARELGMTSYNLFVRMNQPAFGAEEGRLTVDYSALRLSMGDVAPVELRAMAWDDDNVLSVRFRGCERHNLDYVYLYVYVPDCGKGCLSAPVYRYEKKVSMLLPDFFAGHEAQVYLLAMSEDGRWSDSRFAGAIGIGEEREEGGESIDRPTNAVYPPLSHFVTAPLSQGSNLPDHIASSAAPLRQGSNLPDHIASSAAPLRQGSSPKG